MTFSGTELEPALPLFGLVGAVKRPGPGDAPGTAGRELDTKETGTLAAGVVRHALGERAPPWHVTVPSTEPHPTARPRSGRLARRLRPP